METRVGFAYDLPNTAEICSTAPKRPSGRIENSVMDDEKKFYDDYAEDTDVSIAEYDLSAVPSDFNVMTLKQLVDNGWVRIPGFQRHFVWDLARASKLIESLVLGLPVPQLFLYEQDRDRHLLIDGQQRLMSIYYFTQQRFPRPSRRTDLRRVFDEEGNIPERVIQDDEYFQDFRLRLPEGLPGKKSRLAGLKYSTLDEYKPQLDLRPIRCIVIKQNKSSDDDSAMYEVFNRLNTGGINLRPQEIRTSMYHSEFYTMLNQVNLEQDWRRLLQTDDPDLHMKDIEVLLRGFAMLVDGEHYRPSMVKFLNQFSKRSEGNDLEHNQYLKGLFSSFLRATRELPERILMNKKNNRFNIALYEAVFTATCTDAYRQGREVEKHVRPEQIEELKSDAVFNAASLHGTTQTDNVQKRLQRATAILEPC